MEGGVDKGELDYACVTIINPEGTQIRITVQEYDWIGGDEDCLDTFISVDKDSAWVQWTVDDGDMPLLEDKPGDIIPLPSSGMAAIRIYSPTT